MIWPSRGQDVCTADLVGALDLQYYTQGRSQRQAKMYPAFRIRIPVAWEAGMRT